LLIFEGILHNVLNTIYRNKINFVTLFNERSEKGELPFVLAIELKENQIKESKDMIKNALFRLLEVKDLKEITMSEIAEEAGLVRMTLLIKKIQV